ncbi:MAG TPA: DUF2252 family protein [Vicinamibacterales bacterium]|jgi:hypothetical protein
MTDIHRATRAYEAWLRQHVAIVAPDLRRKHERMAESPFVFLRGTFYRWVEIWLQVCRKLAGAPAVNAIGDIHVENFGTWRDAEGRLVWGVNDVDEACRLPYTQDLIRLATSAFLAIGAEHFTLPFDEACVAILDGYRTSLARGGNPIVLAERRRWLRAIAMNDLRDPQMFWARLSAHPTAHHAPVQRLLESSLPRASRATRIVRRIAGVGSLGRPRFVAITDCGGAFVAREAKAWAPSAADRHQKRPEAATRLLERAVRIPDPFFVFHRDWIVRRLAPDCTRIELTELPKRRDEARLLRAMGWEVANLHLGSPTRDVRSHLTGLRSRWLERAALKMSAEVVKDWRAWRSRAE